jgi:AmmeMemoRadiSam system protein B
MATRQPDFAGSWYPDTERGCLAMFKDFEQACVARKGTGPVHGGIVPHAGWVFSGGIAYNVVRELSRAVAGELDTVVLFGGHLGPSAPITIMDHGDFWTPFGPIPTDEELASKICARYTVRQESPERHKPDNTIELQAPIIRHLLPEARLVVVGAPPNDETLALAAGIAELAQELGRRIVALGSTDLTHYGPNYGWSPKGHGQAAERWVREENDPRWIASACGLDERQMIQEALQNSNACCPGAAAASARCGKKLGSTAGELLVYATSSDIRPDASFVGYAGIVF